MSLLLIGMLGGLILIRVQLSDERSSVTFSMGDISRAKKVYKFVADTSLYHFSSHEGKMLASSNFFSPHFLTNFPYKVGDWEGQDFSHQYADITMFRLYRHRKTKRYLWLIAVYGAHQSQFHSAEVCYIGDGWDVARREIKRVTVEGEPFPIRYFIAQKDKSIHQVAYWYLWERSSRKIDDGTLLFRLSVESGKSEEDGNRDLGNFLQSLINLEMSVPKKEGGDISRRIASSEGVEVPPAISRPALPLVVGAEFERSKERAVSWLLSQRVPNRVVPYPQMNRRYMMLSYELNVSHPKSQNDRSYKYIFSRAAIYDNALALIALSMAGKYDEAESLIEVFQRLVEDDGRLWFSYNTHDDWPSKWNISEATVRNGASAWVGYAITFYLRLRALEDPDSFKRRKDFQNYLALAEKLTVTILKDQVKAKPLGKQDPRTGAVTGGWGSFDMVWNRDEDRVAEVYKNVPIEWASVEHNIDFYYLLKNLTYLTKDKAKKKGYQVALSATEGAILRSWNKREGQFNRGLRKDNIDRALALDCASWGLMFANSIGHKGKVKALLQAMKNFEIEDPIARVRGYRPYFKGLVYDEPAINQVFYPHHPTKNWSEIPMVWSEGSLGVAMALLKAGKRSEAKKVIQQILKMQTKSGGVRYATKEVLFQFSTSPSMAGTAWLVMVLYAMDNPHLLDLFWE